MDDRKIYFSDSSCQFLSSEKEPFEVSTILHCLVLYPCLAEEGHLPLDIFIDGALPAGLWDILSRSETLNWLCLCPLVASTNDVSY